jgi:hypothetical protein
MALAYDDGPSWNLSVKVMMPGATSDIEHARAYGSPRVARGVALIDETVQLTCRNSDCGHAPIRNVKRLLNQAARAYRRGERELDT